MGSMLCDECAVVVLDGDGGDWYDEVDDDYPPEEWIERYCCFDCGMAGVFSGTLKSKEPHE